MFPHNPRPTSMGSMTLAVVAAAIATAVPRCCWHGVTAAEAVLVVSVRAFCGGKMFRACQLQSINQLWMLQRLLQRSPTRQLRSALGSVQHLQSIACFVVCDTRYQLTYIVAV